MLCESKLPSIALGNCNAIDAQQTAPVRRNNFCTILPATFFYNAAVLKQENEHELEDVSDDQSLTRLSLTTNKSPSSSPFVETSTQHSWQNVKRRSSVRCNEHMRRVSTLARSKSLLCMERKISKVYDDDKSQTTQNEMRKFQNVLEEMKLAERYFTPKVNIRNSADLESSNVITDNCDNINTNNKLRKSKTCSLDSTKKNDDVHPSITEFCASEKTDWSNLSEQTARGVAELAKDKLENGFVCHILRDKLSESESYLSKMQNARSVITQNSDYEQKLIEPREELTYKFEYKNDNDDDHYYNQRSKAENINDQAHDKEKTTSKNKDNEKSGRNVKRNKTTKFDKEHAHLPKIRNYHLHNAESIERFNSCTEEPISWKGSQKNNQENMQEQEINSDVEEQHESKNKKVVQLNVDKSTEATEHVKFCLVDDNGRTIHIKTHSTKSNNARTTSQNEHYKHTIDNNSNNFNSNEERNYDCGAVEVVKLLEKDTTQTRLNDLLEIINHEHLYVFPQWCDRELQVERKRVSKECNTTTHFTLQKRLNSTLPQITSKSQAKECSDGAIINLTNHHDERNYSHAHRTYKHINVSKKTSQRQETLCKKVVDCRKWRGLGKITRELLQNRLFRIREYEWASERDAALTFEQTVHVLNELRPLRQQMLYNDVLSHYQVRPIEEWGKEIALVKDKESTTQSSEPHRLSLLNDVKNDAENNDTNNSIDKRLEQKHELEATTTTTTTTTTTATTTIVKDHEKCKKDRKKAKVINDSHTINSSFKKESIHKFINTQQLIHAHSINIFRAAAHIEFSRRTAAQQMYIELLRAESDKLLLSADRPYQPRVIANNCGKEDKLLERMEMLGESQEEELQYYNHIHSWLKMEQADVKETNRRAVHHALANVFDRCEHNMVNCATRAKFNLSTFIQIIDESELTPEDILDRPVLEVLEKLSKLFHVTSEEFRRWRTKLEQEVVSTTDYALRFRKTDELIFGQALSYQ